MYSGVSHERAAKAVCEMSQGEIISTVNVKGTPRGLPCSIPMNRRISFLLMDEFTDTFACKWLQNLIWIDYLRSDNLSVFYWK